MAERSGSTGFYCSNNIQQCNHTCLQSIKSTQMVSVTLFLYGIPHIDVNQKRKTFIPTVFFHMKKGQNHLFYFLQMYLSGSWYSILLKLPPACTFLYIIVMFTVDICCKFPQQKKIQYNKTELHLIRYIFTTQLVSGVSICYFLLIPRTLVAAEWRINLQLHIQCSRLLLLLQSQHTVSLFPRLMSALDLLRISFCRICLTMSF